MVKVSAYHYDMISYAAYDVRFMKAWTFKLYRMLQFLGPYLVRESMFVSGLRMTYSQTIRLPPGPVEN